MAKIGIENIQEIKLNVLPFERRFDSQGDLVMPPLVAEMYLKQKYDEKPKSKEEAKAKGEKSFNGLMSSFPRLCVYPQEGKNFVVADIAPTCYLVGQAMRDFVSANPSLSPEEIKKLSPDMANVSLVVPVKIAGNYFLMSQIKGKALGSGEIHAALVAGNVDAQYLSEADPLTATLRGECSEEVGMDLTSLDPTSVVYMVDERETGQVNFAYVARNSDAQMILGAYEASVREKLPKGERLEVMALAELPVGGIALVPLESGSPGLKNITCFFPTEKGLEEKVEGRGVRPYTQAALDYLSKPENVKFLLEKAGF